MLLRIFCKQWDLKERKKQKGAYTKRKHEYWDQDIIKIRRENIILSDISNSETNPGEEDRSDVPANNNKFDYGKCTVKELIGIVNEKGMHRKGHSKFKKRTLKNGVLKNTPRCVN